METRKYAHAMALGLLGKLDAMVYDPLDPDYTELREEIYQRLRISEARNPFNAGPPEIYGREEEKMAEELKRKGLTTRQIAKELRCSQSTVVRLLNKKYFR